MSVAWLMLISTSLLGVISYYLPKPLNKFNKDNIQTTRFIFAFIMFSIIIVLTGLRTVYSDTSAYIFSFENLSLNLEHCFNEYNIFEKKSFFWLSANLFKIFISQDAGIWLLSVSAVSCLCVFFMLYKYSEDFPLSLFLFITMGYYSWLMNGTRQFVSVCLLFLGYHFIVRKKYIVFALIFIIAYLIHDSSIVFIPALFFINVKSPWNKKILFFISLILLCVFFADSFTDFFVDVTESNKEIAFAGGSSFWWIAVSIVPCVIAFINRKKIEEFNDKFINFCIVMSIMSTAFYLLSAFTSGIYIGRIPVFFSVFNMILLPWLIKNCYEGKERAFLYFLCVLAYIYFFSISISPYYSKYFPYLY